MKKCFFLALFPPISRLIHMLPESSEREGRNTQHSTLRGTHSTSARLGTYVPYLGRLRSGGRSTQHSTVRTESQWRI
ncbi:hypothetical protein BDY21DRAFT_354799 [Lineolata rhizophorae]|uniref:Uncharacterized protein n=1 Tax=Lineolata rhizophorae TaxID=578093 RepID=A0A6A6NQJ8_9PEZI|nr:hypothetical protein BDY21DRAFT_354799 [Lineolata rhizophorae]